MRQFFSTANWPFAVKFAVPCVMAFALVLVVESVALRAMNTINASLHEVVDRKYNASLLLADSVERLRAANGDLYLLQVKQAGGLKQDIRAETQRIGGELDRISDDLARFKINYAAPDDRAKIDEVLQNVKSYRKAVAFVGSMLDLDFKATVTFVVPLRDAYDAMIGKLAFISAGFLASSREDAERADQLAHIRADFILLFTTLILVLTVIIMVPVIYSTANSINALARATEKLADGDTQVDIAALTRRDELGRLVKALTIFRDNIERVTALKRVSMLYASMNAMLDALKQGLCSFGPDGICSDIYSRACVPLFAMAPVGRPVGEVLRLRQEEQATTKNLIDLIFSEKRSHALPVQELLDLLPGFLPAAEPEASPKLGHAVSLAYRPILNSTGAIQSVLVVATDHADELAAAQLSRERDLKVQMALRILTYRNQFTQFFHGLTIFCGLTGTDLAKISQDQLKRDIHTSKGIAAMYYLQPVTTALHDIETFLADVADGAALGTPYFDGIEHVRRALAEVRAEVAKILGDDFDQHGAVRTIPLTVLKRIGSEIRDSQNTQASYQQYLRQVIGEPVHHLLAATCLEIGDLADRYGKSIARCTATGEDFQILSEAYSGLFASFTHIASNIVEHAAETAEDRAARGKPVGCVVTITTAKLMRQGRDWLQIAFADDGAGIDVERLRRKLLAHQGTIAPGTSNADLLQQIFSTGVSTSPEITQLSGRGVGLNAVKHEAEALGGAVHVESVLTQYTKIIVEVPFIWDDGPGTQG